MFSIFNNVEKVEDDVTTFYFYNDFIKIQLSHNTYTCLTCLLLEYFLVYMFQEFN